MFPILPILSGGVALAGGTLIVKSYQRQTATAGTLVKALSAPQQPVAVSTTPQLLPERVQESLQIIQTQLGELRTKAAEQLKVVTDYCLALDTRYQHFMQQRIDPLLIGQQYQQQLQELSAMSLRELTMHEKYANRTFPVAITGIGLLTVARWVAFPLHPLIDIIILYVVFPIYQIAWQRTVDQRQLDIYQFSALYTIAMWIGGWYMIGLISIIFMNLCHKVMSMVENQGRYRLVHVFGQQPRTVWVLVDGAEVEIPFTQLCTGNTLVLNAGQVVPCDGVVVAGEAMIDQHMLTGEAQPAEKAVGDTMLAATLVIAGKVHLRAEKTGDETTAAQIGEILNNTGNYRLSIRSEAFERANRMLKPMLAVSGLAWLLAGPYAAAAILGCNLTTSIIGLGPLTMLNYLNRLARRMILVKDGRALETLPTIDTIVFDKTGTLTLERPHVIQIHICHTLTEDEVLRLAAAAEYRQSHPIAQAILTAAHERQLSLPAIEDIRYEVGYGIQVWFEQQLVQVGSARYLALEGIEIPSILQQVQTECHTQGHSLVFVSVEKQVVGAIELQPTLRPEVKQLVQDLRQRNLQLYIISGDQEAPTRRLADTLAMHGYFANVLPAGKAELVTQLQQAGHKVCFIGDGINDAIALKQADVSISLRGATTAATDTAEVIFMDGGLQQLLPLLIEAEYFNNDTHNILHTSAVLSVLSASGVLFAHFTFTAVELLTMLNYSVGLGIANKSWLRERDSAS